MNGRIKSAISIWSFCMADEKPKANLSFVNLLKKGFCLQRN